MPRTRGRTEKKGELGDRDKSESVPSVGKDDRGVP